MTGSARVLIGGVGYRNLRDHSVGPLLVERLQSQDWPSGVEIDDLSFGPIAFVQRLQDLEPYHRVVFVGAVARGRVRGEVYRYRWDGMLPNAEEIQARVAEAVTGVIGLDNLLIISGYFGVLPEEVIMVEIEPVVEEWGDTFTPLVEQALPHAEALIREAALKPLPAIRGREGSDNRGTD